MKSLMKPLLGLMLIFSVQHVVAWNFAIKNMTEGELVGKFYYAACAPIERVIPAWKVGAEPFRLDNGGCCPYQVEVRSTTGPAQGLTAKYFPPTTGLGISCQNNEVTFKLTDDKKQIVGVRGLDQASKGITNFHFSNATDSQLVLTLKYTVPAACMPETKIVDAKKDLDMQIGLCCLESLTIQARGGAADGKQYVLKPVGGPSGCGTLVRHTVRLDGMNNLVVETR